MFAIAEEWDVEAIIGTAVKIGKSALDSSQKKGSECLKLLGKKQTAKWKRVAIIVCKSAASCPERATQF